MLNGCAPDVEIEIDIDCPENWDRDEDGICIEPPNLCQAGYSWDELLQGCMPDDDISINCPEGWDIDEDGICIEPPNLCKEGYSWDEMLSECVEVEAPDVPEFEGIHCTEKQKAMGWSWDSVKQECLPQITVEPPEPIYCTEEQKAKGWSWDSLKEECLPQIDVDVDIDEGCDEGLTWDAVLGKCIEVEVELPDPEVEIPDPELPPEPEKVASTPFNTSWSSLFSYTTIKNPELSKYAPQLNKVRGMFDDIS
jgi:hypothetical protein